MHSLRSLRVVVLGGGITGLAAVHWLAREAGDRLQLTLVEAERLGGKIRTEPLGGRPVEGGPDGFLDRPAAMVELCRDLGLESALVRPAVAGASLWLDRLRPVPGGLALGMPAGMASVLGSGVLSPAGKLRAGLDLILPRKPLEADVGIGELVRARLGSEVLDRLVDPILGGIYAGDSRCLSLAAVAPEIAAAARAHRSLILGLRRARKAGAGPPAFLTLKSGLGSLVDAIVARWPAIRFEVGVGAERVREEDGRLAVDLEDGRALEADRIILALPAFAAARVLRELSPEAAGDLESIQYAPVATVALVYPGPFPYPLYGTGFLVPRSPDRLLVAGTWLSAKWAHLAADGQVLIRCAVGRTGDDRWSTLADADLVACVHTELGAALGQPLPMPVESRVVRWERAIPQYRIGHRQLMEELELRLARWPGLILAGAAYRGLGLASCAAQARAAALRVLSVSALC